MRIFIANLEFPPVSGPGIWRVLSFARHLALAGHDVTVFCSDRSSWHERTDPTLLERVPANVTVRRIPSTFLKDIDRAVGDLEGRYRGGVLAKISSAIRWRINRWWPDHSLIWALKASVVALMAARRERPDAIVTSGPPHIVHIAGFLCSTLLGVKWVMDYRDPWTADGFVDQIIDGPYQANLFRRLEGFLLARADAVTAVSPTWRDQLSIRRGGDGRHVYLLRNGHDLEWEAVSGSLAVSGAAPRQLWIHFNGTVQRASDLMEPLVDALRLLTSEHGIPASRFRFTFCGLRRGFLSRPDMDDMRDVFSDFGPLTHGDAIGICRQADCLLVMVRDGSPAVRGVIPAKTYELLALGRPVLALLPGGSDVRELLHDYPLAVVSQGVSASEIAVALMQVLQRLSYRTASEATMTPIQRRQFFDRYRRAAQAEQLMAVVESVSRP